APVLGIDTELGRAGATAAPSAPVLDEARAREYVEAVHSTQWLPATGLPLFVLSAAPLLLLIAATTDASGEPAGWAIATGLAPVLGIDTELGRAGATAAPSAPVLDEARAREYVEAVHSTQWLPATGLPLFVLSAAPLLLLIAATTDASGEPAGWAIATGIAAV